MRNDRNETLLKIKETEKKTQNRKYDTSYPIVIEKQIIEIKTDTVISNKINKDTDLSNMEIDDDGFKTIKKKNNKFQEK